MRSQIKHVHTASLSSVMTLISQCIYFSLIFFLISASSTYLQLTLITLIVFNFTNSIASTRPHVYVFVWRALNWNIEVIGEILLRFHSHPRIARAADIVQFRLFKLNIKRKPKFIMPSILDFAQHLCQRRLHVFDVIAFVSFLATIIGLIFW